jgi:hypothetical protein
MAMLEHVHSSDSQSIPIQSAVYNETTSGLTTRQTAQSFIRQLDGTRSNADSVVGHLELVQDGRPYKAQEVRPSDVERGAQALLSDARNGDSFSPDSIAAFQRVYQEAANAPGATPDSVLRQLNGIGAAINRNVAPELSQIPGRRAEPIGMVRNQNPDGSYSFYMMLNKDNEAAIRNLGNVTANRPSPTIIQLGPFTPGLKT